MTALRLLACTSALWLLAAHAWAQTGPAVTEAVPVAVEAAASAPAAAADPAADSAAVPSIVPALPLAGALQVIEGRVAYYARKFVGRRTASGERHTLHELTMAHLTLPLGTLVRVTNLATQRSVIVRVNDRGPYARGRVADVSLAAARALDMLHAGVVQARLEVLR